MNSKQHGTCNSSCNSQKSLNIECMYTWYLNKDDCYHKNWKEMPMHWKLCFSVNCKSSIEIHCELVAIYGGHVIKWKQVPIWCSPFTTNCTNLQGELHAGCWNSSRAEENIMHIETFIQDHRWYKLYNIVVEIDLPIIVACRINHNKLEYRKLSGCWVPKQLTENKTSNA